MHEPDGCVIVTELRVPTLRRACHLKGQQYTLSSLLVLVGLPLCTTTTMGLSWFLFVWFGVCCLFVFVCLFVCCCCFLRGGCLVLFSKLEL